MALHALVDAALHGVALRITTGSAIAGVIERAGGALHALMIHDVLVRATQRDITRSIGARSISDAWVFMAIWTRNTLVVDNMLVVCANCRIALRIRSRSVVAGGVRRPGRARRAHVTLDVHVGPTRHGAALRITTGGVVAGRVFMTWRTRRARMTDDVRVRRANSVVALRIAARRAVAGGVR